MTGAAGPVAGRRLGPGAVVVGLVVALGVGVVVAAASAPAPPPSPLEYATDALAIMEEQGLHVDPATWPQVRMRAMDTVGDAADYEDTYFALTAAIDAAGGDHSSFLPPGMAAAGGRQGDDPAPRPAVTSSGTISSIQVPHLSVDDPAVQQGYADAAASGLRAADQGTACGWVVDLRGNHGGNMWPMLAGLSSLIPDGEVMSFVDRHGRREVVALQDGTALLDGEHMARVPNDPKIDKPVAVLQDRETASSAEAVLLAFRGLPHVRTFGSASSGYSTANSAFPMYDGATLILTTAVFADRSGRRHGNSIAPDEEIPDSAAAEAAARAWLLQACNRR